MSRLSIMTRFPLLMLSSGLALLGAEEAAGDDGVITAEVDWMQEIVNGGNTAIVLILLIMVMVTVIVERFLNLRAQRVAPHEFVEEVEPLWQEGRYDDILDSCEDRPSTLSRMTAYLVEHRHADPELLIPGASDIGIRELRTHTQKAFTLAVIAGLAPLLGLLGTMIGMIESFTLVAEYGDDGGASMLAESISKALITTALGLIIAIPSLAIYHFFKYRISSLGTLLDEELEQLVNSWLLKKNGEHVASPIRQQATEIDGPRSEIAMGQDVAKRGSTDANAQQRRAAPTQRALKASDDGSPAQRPRRRVKN